jgi:hypothetical protein
MIVPLRLVESACNGMPQLILGCEVMDRKLAAIISRSIGQMLLIRINLRGLFEEQKDVSMISGSLSTKF